ncbi:right-handed parallel beta-helix repeat-containing protein, partial [bacterium]|nr:right-handed parallel beta-helix repeat-containing protein [bacterium]
GGTVRLGSTFTVEDGDSLVVLPGTRVYADKDADPPVRLQVNGMIDVQGGAGADEVLFSSYDPATGQLDAGTWGGLEFNLDGAEDAYGYFGSLEAPSSIVGAAIAHADTAIRFTDLCAPTLEDIRFENIASGIGILFDGTDVMIPSGYWDPAPPAGGAVFHEVPAKWVFTDTLAVRATSSSSNDWGWPGGTWGTVDEPGQPDLLVQGKMTMSGAVPNSFLPEVPASPSLGSDWGGITFMTPSSGNRLYNAHVSGAVNPVRVIAVDQSAGTEIKNCLIEQFRDVGVGIKGSQYVEVSGCTIRRGADMAEIPDRAQLGISIEESAPRIDGNTIFDTEDLGIQIMNATGPSKYECIAMPANPESLLVTGNQIEAGSHSTSSANGIDTAWICAFYEAQVQENYIEHWGGAGIKMHQCVNTKVSCNQVRDCGTALLFERTDLADQPPVRLQQNNLSDCANNSQVVKTDNGKKLKLGPNTAYTGSNKLKIDPQPSELEWFITQDDTSNVLDARSCGWRLGSGDLLDGAVVLTHMKVSFDSMRTPLVDVDATPPSWASMQLMCLPQDQTPPPEADHGIGPAGSHAVAEADPHATFVADLPFVPGLQIVGPNPSSGTVSLLLGVEGTEENVAIVIYDVSGRRVRTIRNGVLPGGMHRLAWNLRDDDGNRTAPGAYFVRTQRSTQVENHKIIVVR